MRRSERWFPLLVALVAVVLAVGAGVGRAEAVVEIQWWHAMSGALEEWVKDLAEGLQQVPGGVPRQRHLQGQPTPRS
jgi:ABC-type glycerol-3-phosphate transport system substrate-binding protein